MNWIKILIFILKLIASGMGEMAAMSLASNKFGTSIRDIKKHL